MLLLSPDTFLLALMFISELINTNCQKKPYKKIYIFMHSHCNLLIMELIPGAFPVAYI